MDAEEGPAHGAYRPNITRMKQPTAKEVQARMIALHHELSNFLFYLAHNSGRLPPTAEEEDQKAINHVQELLERETNRMAIAVKRQELDGIVEKSLRDAGFPPDEPEDDTKA